MVYASRFSKDLDKIRQKTVRESIAELLLRLKQAEKLADVAHLDLEKISGAKNAYRIRVGEWRVCFFLEKGELRMARVLDRKEVYKNFP